ALPVLGQVVLLAGAKSNVVVQVGEEGAFVVDTATAESSDQIVKAIHGLTHGPISYIVNTSFDPDHFGGNENIRKAGENPTLAPNNITGPGTRPAGGRGGGGGGQPQRQETAIIFSH